MRHHNSNRKFGRETKQRNALLNGLMVALVEQEKIETTLAKAKELRSFIEPMITKAKTGTVHARRIVSSRLMNNAEQTKKIMDVLAPKYKSVNGGYTRVIKLPTRLSDGAQMAVIEFV
jgi:large subunit ribosomal protein L17